MDLVEDIDPNKEVTNDIFYFYPTYDALDFEIQGIIKLLQNYTSLFDKENSNGYFKKTNLEARERKILIIMLINKAIHYMETLGATSLAILKTKSKKPYERYNEKIEKDIFIKTLSTYTVGDVVNFYRDIETRPYNYLYRLFGYPPSEFQTTEINSVFKMSCKNTSLILFDIGKYYRRHKDVYNAYKHGYRIVIPDNINTRDGLIINEEHNIHRICYFEENEISIIQNLTNNCRQIFELVRENNKKSMMVKSGKKIRFELKTIVTDNTAAEAKKISETALLHYPTTDEEKELLISQQDTLLKGLVDLPKYKHKFILLDLDDEKIVGSGNTLNEVSDFQREIDTSNRLVSLKITTNKLKELGFSEDSN